MSDGFLHRYFINNGHKPLHKWVHYFDIYERHFERFRGQSPTMLAPFTQSTASISFYDSIVVFEKRPQGARLAPMTRPMPREHLR